MVGTAFALGALRNSPERSKKNKDKRFMILNLKLEFHLKVLSAEKLN